MKEDRANAKGEWRPEMPGVLNLAPEADPADEVAGWTMYATPRDAPTGIEDLRRDRPS